MKITEIENNPVYPEPPIKCEHVAGCKHNANYSVNGVLLCRQHAAYRALDHMVRGHEK